MDIWGPVTIFIAIGVATSVAALFGRGFFKFFYERRGLFGAMFVCYITAFLLWNNAWSVAAYIGGDRSTVEFIAILFIIIPTTILIARYRAPLEKTAKTTSKAGKLITRATKKVRGKSR